MLIIFDLDDTLIDTSGGITPVKLEMAFKKMCEAGLKVKNVKHALLDLIEIDKMTQSARETLKIFLEKYSGKKFFDLACDIVYNDMSDEVQVKPLFGVKDVLQNLYKMHTLAMVTVGKEQLQLKKLKKAGIDYLLFSKIIVSETKDKKPHYEALIKEFLVPPSETIVCGDRIAIDLLPAKELHMKTVHMKWGRGRALSSEKYVDYTIDRLEQIEKIIVGLKKK